jgi:hypothetical protein
MFSVRPVKVPILLTHLKNTYSYRNVDIWLPDYVMCVTTNPLTEMSTRNISWGVKAAGA